MSQGERVRLFLDSNVLTAGIVSTWGLDKAVLSLCAARICRLVLAEAVREEVEDNLLIRLSRLESGEGNRVVADYARLIALMKPEIVPYPGQAEVKAAHTPPARWVTTWVSDCRWGRPRRRELRAAQRMAIRARIGRPSRAPQLTPAPLARTSPSSTARPGEKCWPASMRTPRRNIERPAISPLRRSRNPITGRSDSAR